MKTGHFPCFFLILLLQPIWSGANESPGGKAAGFQRSPELPLDQQFQGQNAAVKLSDGESLRGESEDLDPMKIVSHSGKGGSGGKGGGRSVGAGGSQAVRGPRTQRRSDAPPILSLTVSFTLIFFHEFLVSVLFF